MKLLLEERFSGYMTPLSICTGEALFWQSSGEMFSWTQKQATLLRKNSSSSDIVKAWINLGCDDYLQRGHTAVSSQTPRSAASFPKTLLRVIYPHCSPANIRCICCPFSAFPSHTHVNTEHFSLHPADASRSTQASCFIFDSSNPFYLCWTLKHGQVGVPWPACLSDIRQDQKNPLCFRKIISVKKLISTSTSVLFLFYHSNLTTMIFLRSWKSHTSYFSSAYSAI